MQLKSSLMISNIEDERTLLFVLKTTKCVISFTKPSVTLDWFYHNSDFMIIGSNEEIEITKCTLAQTLGLVMEDDCDVTLCPRVNATGPVTVQNVVSEPVQNVVPESPVDSAPSEATIDDMMRDAQPVMAFNETSPLSDISGSQHDNYSARRALADQEMDALILHQMSGQMTGDTQWTTLFNRRSMVLTPTESNSGTISTEEQITFSEERNPRRWNLAKCRYNGSRYYLSYLVPPSANINDTLRVVGGINDGATPEVFEICVFNTEQYWRELRHLMHRQAEFLREMAC